jgi:hypothetical protein
MSVIDIKPVIDTWRIVNIVLQTGLDININ